MNVYIYQADIYCERCALELMKTLQPSRYSESYPQGPYPDGGGEADCPQHCGSHDTCLNALELSDGRKVGQFLENQLTSDGVEYVKNSHGEVADIWRDFYDIRELEDE